MRNVSVLAKRAVERARELPADNVQSSMMARTVQSSMMATSVQASMMARVRREVMIEPRKD